MISLMRKLDGTMETFNAALTEAEYFANLCVLTPKQCLHMRLLAEELLGLGCSLLELHDGVFWIEVEQGHFELHLNVKEAVGLKTRDKLMEASSSGENEMYKGITGKIRQAMEWLLEPYWADEANKADIDSGVMHKPNCQHSEWSLGHYRESISSEEKARDWDELEKSVLGRLADDVSIGVKSNCIEIIIMKTF